LENYRSLSVGFISLGCAKNLVDSEIMATGLWRSGFRLAAAPEKADVLLINTCAFIRDAKQEAIEAILEASERKRNGRLKLLLVAGCLPQRYKGELRNMLPEVDAFIGLDRLEAAPRLLKKLLREKKGVFEVTSRPSAVFDPPLGRIIFTDAPHAYLKIAEGCDHHCSFCAIPQIRGRFRSRTVASIAREAEDLLGRGIRELDLIAQDVTSYGRDLGGKNNLAFLLRRLGRIGGRFWVRLLYGHPAHVTDDLLDAVAETKQVCRYLDLPIQHCDAEILRRMNRGGNEFRLRTLFQRIRNRIPDISLRTTCLVGFPGETPAAFSRLVDFVGEAGFDHLGVFVYSAEEGTRAAALQPQVAAATAKTRRGVLLERQQKLVHKKLSNRIGKIEEILIEKQKPGTQYIRLARSFRQAPEIDGAVQLKDRAGKCKPGMFVRARYVKTQGYDLVAETV